MAIEALQLALPNARVLYSSATGASEPMNMAYMVRGVLQCLTAVSPLTSNFVTWVPASCM